LERGVATARPDCGCCCKMYVEDESPEVAGYGSHTVDVSDSAQAAKFQYQSLEKKKSQNDSCFSIDPVYLKGFFAGVCLAMMVIVILVVAGCFSTSSSGSCEGDECEMAKVVDAICDGTDAQSDGNCGVYDEGTVVRIFNVPVYPIGAANIARALEYEAIEELTMIGTSIGNDGAISIASKIENHQSLKTLRIHKDAISSDGACGLGSMLETNEVLENMDLYKNTINNDGAECLANGLRGNSHLIYLSLYGNKIGEQGALYLADSFSVNMILRTLTVTDNLINNGGVGADALSQAEAERTDAGGELDITWESD